ncbi:MAG: hypothetical protein JWO03_958 [Bacteroidetes bacterium]|nr:hypothetical protein [Bacteroidota bacterium]
MEEATQTDEAKKAKRIGWLKKSGIAVFLFFLIKGLVWVGLAAAVWMGLRK